MVSIVGNNGPKVVHLNRRKATREKCLDCSGWSHTDVKNCEFTDCSLHSFRSGQGKQSATARSKAIRKYCLRCMNGRHSEITKCPSTDCSLFMYRKYTLDRSLKIQSLPKKAHIRPIFEKKNGDEYLRLGCDGIS